MLWPKKNSYKEYDNDKKFRRLENPPPPHPNNFSNGPSLTWNCLKETITIATRCRRFPACSLFRKEKFQEKPLDQGNA